MDFDNKVVLVTGASSGIGKATALLFAKHGAKLSIVAIPEEEADLRQVGEDCGQMSGHEPLVIFADLSTDEGCNRTAKETVNHFGRLDVLVNNAGTGARGDLESSDMTVFDRIFNLNVRGLYNLTRLLVPALIETKGNIVNVSSICATTIYAGTSMVYSMSKAAVSHFTRLLAFELASKGVRVNGVCPGLVVTKFCQRITGISDEEFQAWVKNVEKYIPLGRACNADDIAKTIVNLAGPNSELVTGSLVTIDGGCKLMGAALSPAFQKQII